MQGELMEKYWEGNLQPLPHFQFDFDFDALIYAQSNGLKHLAERTWVPKGCTNKYTRILACLLVPYCWIKYSRSVLLTHKW